MTSPAQPEPLTRPVNKLDVPMDATRIFTASPFGKLSEELMASPSTSPTAHGAAEAKRAMSVCDAWKPMLDRRQSWDDQEYKRQLQMGHIDEVKTGFGFSERK